TRLRKTNRHIAYDLCFPLPTANGLCEKFACDERSGCVSAKEPIYKLHRPPRSVYECRGVRVDTVLGAGQFRVDPNRYACNNGRCHNHYYPWPLSEQNSQRL